MAKKKVQRKAKVMSKVDARAGNVSFTLEVKTWGLDSILGAAYLSTDKNLVSLDGDRAKKIKVTLEPAAGKATEGELQDLTVQFELELETARVRWEISRNNLTIREHIAQQAALTKPEPAAGPASPNETELTAEQQSEIDTLISEVEDEIKEMNEKNKIPDPKGIRESWEHKNLK